MTIAGGIRWRTVALVLLLLASPLPAQTTAPATRLNLAPYGIELAPPPGWVWKWDRRACEIARWEAPANPAEVAPPPYIKVLAVPAKAGVTDEASAKKQAAEAAGGVAEPVELDGQPTWRASNPSFAGVYCTRRGVRYMIACEDDAPDRQARLKAFCAAWKWRSPEKPPKAAELDAKPVPIAGGRFTLGLPAWMRWAKHDPPNDRVSADWFCESTFLDLPPKSAFSVAVSMTPQEQGLSLNQIWRREGQTMQRAAKLAKSVKFKRIGAPDGGGIISEVVPSPDPTGLKLWTRAIVSPDARSRVTLDVMFNAADAGDRAGFAALAEKIATSVQAADAMTQATRPVTQPAATRP